MSAHGAVFALVVEMTAGFNVLLHIDEPNAFCFGELFLKASVRVISCDDDAHTCKNYREKNEYGKSRPKHSGHHLPRGRSVKEGAEIYRSTDSYQRQRKIHKKVRIKRWRQLAAMRAYLHTFGYTIMANLAFSNDASPLI